MGNYNNPYKSGQMNLTDRVAIEVGLAKGESFKEIARVIGRDPVTVSREIKENRTVINPDYFHRNDCMFISRCFQKQICGAEKHDCNEYCRRCREFDCRKTCSKYESCECEKTLKPPYVCNNCYYRINCKKTRYFYTAKHADAAVAKRRSNSRKGAQVSKEELENIDAILKPLIRKGQSLTHIYAEHEKEFPVS